MFRTVTDFVDAPVLLLVCDDRRCGSFVTKQLPKGTNEEQRNAAIEPFIGEVMAGGWIVAIDQHLCPGHVQKIREGRRMVQIPNIRM